MAEVLGAWNICRVLLKNSYFQIFVEMLAGWILLKSFWNMATVPIFWEGKKWSNSGKIFVYKHLPDRTLVYEVTIWLPIYCQKDKFVAFAALELFNWPNANLFFAMCTSLPGTIPCALFYYAVILALCTLLHCVHCLLCSDLCQGVSCSCGHRR